MSGVVWKPGDLDPIHYGNFFGGFRSTSPISGIKMLLELKRERNYQCTKIAANVYRKLAKIFYSEQDYKIFTQRVGMLSIKNLKRDVEKWIDERNSDIEKTPLSLIISEDDFRLLPDTFKTLETLHHLIISNVNRKGSLDFRGWDHIKNVVVINAPNSEELGYLADDEAEYEADHTDSP